jgi:hypothetical protein
MLKLYLKKKFYQITKNFRISNCAGKTLLFLWVKKDLSTLKGSIGLDLAGGNMSNKRFFFTDKYICLDINQSKLDVGFERNPDAIAINCRIEEFLNDKSQSKADVILCVQTMGTNIHFDINNTIDVVELMYNFLNKDGSMIFNIGIKAGDLSILKKKIFEKLDKKFKFIDCRFYGAFHTKTKSIWYNRIIFLLAILMNIFSPLRTMFGTKVEKIYFYCYKKL